MLRACLVLFGAFTVLTGVVYPVAITAIAQLAFPDPANGSLLERDGVVIGSSLIGQSHANPPTSGGARRRQQSADASASAEATSVRRTLRSRTRSRNDRGAARGRGGGDVASPSIRHGSGSGLDTRLAAAY
jgi:K+-transporting ATPase ATPase C chain